MAVPLAAPRWPADSPLEAALHDLHARVPEPLLADAQQQAPNLGVAALVQLALARFAGWPESAAQVAARPRAPNRSEPG